MNRERQARQLQMLIATVFLGLGGWCLVAPDQVLQLGAAPGALVPSRLQSVVMGAFGAQAMLFGLISLTTRFTARTFLALAIALLPFFVFDWWFYSVEPIFNRLILLDLAGNLIMLAACLRGWQLLKQAEA